MKEKTQPSKYKIILKNIFFVWGIISALIIIVITIVIASQVTMQKDQVDTATKSDVGFVLNWPGLGAERIQNVVHSFVSSRSLTGDHIDAYAIKIDHVTLDELNKTSTGLDDQWYQGDKLPQDISDAVSDISLSRSDAINWFPSEKEIRSDAIYVWAWNVSYHEATPTAYDLILIRPSDNMVFYISTKR